MSSAQQARREQAAAWETFEQGGELVIHLPLPPRSIHPNGRVYWIAKAKDIRRYRQQAAEMAATQTLDQYGRRPELGQAVIRLRYHFLTPARGGLKPNDPDNLISWAKAAVDALQDARVLLDDRQILYLPPEQYWLPRAKRDAPQPLPQLEVVVSRWDAQRCPLCTRPFDG